MRRRDFIAILAGSAANWPLVAAGQPRVPVIGFLAPQAPVHEMLAKFDQGLSKWGYSANRNVAMEYRWAGNQGQELVDAGGLMSYGVSHSGAWRQIGEYAGRILNGAKPAELPVQVHDQYELVINMKAAERLVLTVPPLLHGLADEVIE